MYGSQGEEGVIEMAVNQLFYAMEETPNRKFLVTVSFWKLILLSVNCAGLGHYYVFFFLQLQSAFKNMRGEYDYSY